jgi:hypothetical protein
VIWSETQYDIGKQPQRPLKGAIAGALAVGDEEHTDVVSFVGVGANASFRLGAVSA